MKEIPGTLAGGGAAFGTTRWSVVVACNPTGDTPPGVSQAALTTLCHDYWPPLYSFVRRRGYSAHDAQDLVQGFFVHLIEKRAYTQADPAKGKFRSFLLASLKHYLADHWDRANRLRRGGGQEFVLLDEELADAEAGYRHEPSDGPCADADRLFERRWAAALVSRAMDHLEAESVGTAQRARVFAALKVFLTGGADVPSQEEAAASLGVPLTTLRSHLSRLRAQYREILRAEVARTVARVEDVPGELQHLARVLAAGC